LLSNDGRLIGSAHMVSLRKNYFRQCKICFCCSAASHFSIPQYDKASARCNYCCAIIYSIDRTVHTRSRTAHINIAQLNNYIKFLHYTFSFLITFKGREREGGGIMNFKLTFLFLNVSSSALRRISALIDQYGARRSSVITETTLRAGWSGLRILIGEYLIPNHSQNGPGAQPASISMGIDVLPRG